MTPDTGKPPKRSFGGFGHDRVPAADTSLWRQCQSGSSFHGIDEPLYPFVFTPFRMENRCALFPELP